MNYEDSGEILQKIKQANNILVNCHHNPDADSVGSALSMYQILLNMNKECVVVTPSVLADNFQFLPNSDKIETIDFSNFGFSKHDLLITLDSSSWNRVSGGRGIEKPNIPIVVIDHHVSNQRYGEVNLVVADKGSNCEVLFNIYRDWGVEITKEVAECLLTGVIGDTGAFRFPEADESTLMVAGELMARGADKRQIIFNLYQKVKKQTLEFWTETLSSTQIEEGFVWAKADYGLYEKHGKPASAKSELADMLFQSIDGTSFGWIALEETPGNISVSFRSRDGFDVSKLAGKLGGGGHKWASAARMSGEFDEVIKKILEESKQEIDEEKEK